jgi:hypothetical protein
MWFFLWLVMSVFVMGFFLWSMAILQQQKKAWYFFAKRMGFTYKAGKYTDSPIVTGLVKHYKVTFFTDSLRINDVRGRRFVTTIEIELGSGMPATTVLATKDFNDYLAPLRDTETYRPPGNWDQSYIVKTRNKEALARYMTPERVKILSGIFSIKNSASLFFFDRQDCILRIETPDPIRDAARMEKMARRLFTAVDGLALSAAELRQFAMEALPPEPADPVQAPAAEKPAEEKKPQSAGEPPK